jgi:hypothetical protein
LRITIDLAGYAALRETVGAAVYAADPIGLLAAGCPSDEYGPEIVQIIPHVRTATSADDLRDKVHRIFVDSFDERMAGPAGAYASLASALWALRQPS